MNIKLEGFLPVLRGWDVHIKIYFYRPYSVKFTFFFFFFSGSASQSEGVEISFRCTIEDQNNQEGGLNIFQGHHRGPEQLKGGLYVFQGRH